MLFSEWVAKYDEEHKEERMIHCVYCGGDLGRESEDAFCRCAACAEKEQLEEVTHCPYCGSRLRDRGPSAYEPGMNEFECPNGHANVYILPPGNENTPCLPMAYKATREEWYYKEPRRYCRFCGEPMKPGDADTLRQYLYDGCDRGGADGKRYHCRICGSELIAICYHKVWPGATITHFACPMGHDDSHTSLESRDPALNDLNRRAEWLEMPANREPFQGRILLHPRIIEKERKRPGGIYEYIHGKEIKLEKKLEREGWVRGGRLQADSIRAGKRDGSWAAIGRSVFFMEGKSWVKVKTYDNCRFFSVHEMADGQVWAAGDGCDSMIGVFGVIACFNGKRWSMQRFPRTGTLEAISVEDGRVVVNGTEASYSRRLKD